VSDDALEAVLFDLDDTLYPQAEFLAGAWRAVAAACAALADVPAEKVLAALETVAADGSDRGRIIDRALGHIGLGDLEVEPLVNVFRSYAPERLRPFSGARRALRLLRARVPIGLVTDGDVGIQRAKLHALELESAFDVIVFSDELGREHRKPDPLPFITALGALSVASRHAVYIGDRSDKDVAGAAAAGLRAIRVLTGEYAGRHGHAVAWQQAPDVVAAVALCDPYLAARASGPDESRDPFQDDELTRIARGERPCSPGGDGGRPDPHRGASGL